MQSWAGVTMGGHKQDRRLWEVIWAGLSYLCAHPQDALNSTREYEEKLKETQGMCNDSMLALWEECKPCLKQTCMKFYARVCRSGSGAVGQQVRHAAGCLKNLGASSRSCWCRSSGQGGSGSDTPN